MSKHDAEVLIAGAGPVGLMLATELRTAGVSALVIERRADIDTTIKAGGIGPLAAEALARRGLGGALAEVEQRRLAIVAKAMGVPTLKFGGKSGVKMHFAGLQRIDQARQAEPERRYAMVGQQELEEVLDVHVRAIGVDLRREHALVSFEQDAEGVTVEVQTPSGPRSLRVGYLVGCDGGRSLVRKRAGFDFPGTEPTITGYQAIVELDAPDKLLPMGWRQTGRGMLVYGPVPGRIVSVEFDGPPKDRSAEITREELQASLRRVSGTDVTITAVKTATRFTDHARQATTYRMGRVLLAGDAAHVHSPFGGQGLNLGMMDAVNLGWKLAATVQGWAPADLLDTYTSEQHPVAARVLALTRAQVALMRPDPQTLALRDLFAEMMEVDEVNRMLGGMMRGIDVRYAIGDEHPMVGRACPDLAMTTDAGVETQISALACDGKALLVEIGGTTLRAAASPWGDRVRYVAARALARGDLSALLIRPDGCIAWAAPPGPLDEASLRRALERWFGAPRDRVVQ